MQSCAEVESESSEPSQSQKDVPGDDTNLNVSQVSSTPQKDDAGYDFWEDVDAAFVVLLNTFEYLTCRDLLRASRVSKLWNYVTSHNVIWKRVTMDGKLCNCQELVQKLQKHGTQSLDLRQMRFNCRSREFLASDPYWVGLFEALKEVKTLTKLNVGLCPVDMITLLAETSPQLKSVALTCYSIDFTNLWKLQNLQELELRFKRKGLIIRDVHHLKELKNLKSLSLRRLFYIDEVVEYVPISLESLVLGATSVLPSRLPTKILPAFVNLKRLRLEKGQDGALTTEIVAAVSTMPNLSQLELINFYIKDGFQTALGDCNNLKTLLIIPYCWKIYDSYNAHQIVIDGAISLKGTLKKFILGFHLEFISTVERVFNEQVKKIRYIGEEVNVPFKTEECNCESKSCSDSVHIDMISLNILEKEMLPKFLPETKVKILKIPFLETWNQVVT